MFTLKLWRALSRSIAPHPSYTRLIYSRNFRRIEAQNIVLLKRRSTNSIPIGLVATGLIISIATIMILGPGSSSGIVFSTLCFTPFLALLALATFCGASYAINVSTALSREREQGRFDLAQITPLGPEGVAWSVGSAAYHSSAFLGQLRDLARGVYIIVSAGLVLVIGASLLMWAPVLFTGGRALSINEFVDQLALAGPFFIITTAVYGDLLQSILTGYVIGMIAPILLAERIQSQSAALGLFLGIQFSLYAIAAIAGFLLLPEIVGGSAVVVNAIRLIIFIGIRETALIIMWRLLAQSLDVDPKALEITAGFH